MAKRIQPTSAHDAQVSAAIDQMFDKAESLSKGQEPTQEPEKDPAADDLEKGKGESCSQYSKPDGEPKADGGDMTPINKGDKGKKDEDEDEDDGEEMEDEKSTISGDDLSKALDTVMAVAAGAGVETQVDRRKELAEKLASGELEKGEMEELHALIKSELRTDDEDLDKSYTESLLDDEDLQEEHEAGVFDVTGFLKRQSALIGESLDSIQKSLSDDLSKGFDQVNRFNLAMARANKLLGRTVIEQGELMKSLVERIETVENQPVGRRAAPTARALQKGFTTGGGGDDLSKSDYERGFQVLTDRAREKGDFKIGAYDLTHVITQANVTNYHPQAIPPEIKAEVRKIVGK